MPVVSLFRAHRRVGECWCWCDLHVWEFAAATSRSVHSRACLRIQCVWSIRFSCLCLTRCWWDREREWESRCSWLRECAWSTVIVKSFRVCCSLVPKRWNLSFLLWLYYSLVPFASPHIFSQTLYALVSIFTSAAQRVQEKVCDANDHFLPTKSHLTSLLHIEYSMTYIRGTSSCFCYTINILTARLSFRRASTESMLGESRAEKKVFG